jgi:hypothetical protein
MTVMGALLKAGYMTVVSGAEALIAVMLLTNRFVPLALAMLAPILGRHHHVPYRDAAGDHWPGRCRSGDGTLPHVGLSRHIPANARRQDDTRRELNAV